MSLTVTGTIQVRRDTAANWTADNPTLSAGEFGYETDTGDVKIGNGADDWVTLPYIISGSVFGGAFTDLSDVPATYVGQALEYVRVNAAETALEFAVLPSPGSTTFEGLTDTFTFAGNALEFVRVNAAETDLEPVVLDNVAISGAYADLSGTPVLATVATTGAYADLIGEPTTQPADIAGFYPGVPAASVLMTRIPIATSTTFAAAFAGSYGTATVAATAQTDFDIQDNGASVGTMRFAAAATTASFLGAGSTLAAGDILSVVAPGTPDLTLANVGFNLHGTRSI